MNSGPLLLSKRFFAWASSHRNRPYERLMEQRKRTLLSSVNGTVLEIGAGPGSNFSYIPASVRYIALEPNPFMHRHLIAEARRLGFEAGIIVSGAENIPLGDASVDAVIGTLVLCSVGDPQRVVNEISRVLKPGGVYYFIEHVAAPEGTFLRRVQRFIRPCWRLTSDGCRPDRETGGIIRSGGFGSVEIEEFRVGAPVVSPHISGRARKVSFNKDYFMQKETFNTGSG